MQSFGIGKIITLTNRDWNINTKIKRSIITNRVKISRRTRINVINIIIFDMRIKKRILCSYFSSAMNFINRIKY
jgi:hypothetical protein